MIEILKSKLNMTALQNRCGISCWRRNCWRAAVMLCCATCCMESLWGQTDEAKPKTEQTSDGLVDGLLDLLVEPKVGPESDANSKPKPSNPSDPSRPQLTPAEVGLDGEDLGESSSNPLISVRQSMLIAAGYLRKGVTNAETQELQSNIVERLDLIIEELEKAPPPNRSPREQSAAESAQSQEARRRAEQRQQQTAGSKRGEPSSGEATDEPGEPNGEPVDRPTERAPNQIAVELSDPKSLQQSVWGQLPERVRQQMQSRMVEQFLPAYREQIEAYFQALLK